VVHGLEAEYHQEIDFVYLDIDDGRTDPFKRELGFGYQPHLFLLDEEGRIVEQWIGYVEGQRLARAFDRLTE
jgi:hypothetical protein